MIHRILAITGPIGTGRATTARLLKMLISNDDRILQMTMRQVLAWHVQRNTHIGLWLQKTTVNPGHYVPDNIVVPAIQQWLEHLTASDPELRIFLSGFPRTERQLRFLEGQVSVGILNLVAPPELSENRPEDDELFWLKSWHYHMEYTQPVVERHGHKMGHLLRHQPLAARLRTAIHFVTADEDKRKLLLERLDDQTHPIHLAISEIERRQQILG